MSFQLVLSDEAVLDIEDAFVWYQKIEPNLSEAFEKELYQSIAQITRNPNNFQIKYKNVKVIYLKKFPYGIHYFINEKTILVIGVFHTSRSPKRWFLRIK